MSDKLIGKIKTAPKLQGNIRQNARILGHLAYSTYELNMDYNRLANKPSIEGVTLIDDKSFEDLGAISLTNMEIENLINLQV